MLAYTQALQNAHDFPIFSPPDILTPNTYAQLRIFEITPKEERERLLNIFWANILWSGIVTDLFATPRWEKSRGATMEHDIMQQQGARIHYVTEDVLRNA